MGYVVTNLLEKKLEMVNNRKGLILAGGAVRHIDYCCDK